MVPSHFLKPPLVLNIPLRFNTFLIPSTFLRLYNSSKIIVEPNDPHIFDLLVSHYDCSKQNNLSSVQTCEQAPSPLEYTRVIANV